MFMNKYLMTLTMVTMLEVEQFLLYESSHKRWPPAPPPAPPSCPCTKETPDTGAAAAGAGAGAAAKKRTRFRE